MKTTFSPWLQHNWIEFAFLFELAAITLFGCCVLEFGTATLNQMVPMLVAMTLLSRSVRGCRTFSSWWRIVGRH
jgi:hypothetical protein